MKKCDNLSLEIKEIKKAHQIEVYKLKEEHKKEISELKEQHKKEVEILNKKIGELELENDILKGKANQKNSSNSNIPPSKDEYKIQNHREKSIRNQGGQKGRKGKTLTIEDVEFVEEHYMEFCMGNK